MLDSATGLGWVVLQQRGERSGSIGSRRGRASRRVRERGRRIIGPELPCAVRRGLALQMCRSRAPGSRDMRAAWSASRGWKETCPTSRGISYALPGDGPAPRRDPGRRPHRLPYGGVHQFIWSERQKQEAYSAFLTA